MADDRRQPCHSASRCRRRTGRKSGDGPHKRGLNTKIHLAVDAHGMPVRFFISSGTTADCTVAAQLIDGFRAEYLPADRGYDTDAIIRSKRWRSIAARYAKNAASFAAAVQIRCIAISSSFIDNTIQTIRFLAYRLCSGSSLRSDILSWA